MTAGRHRTDEKVGSPLRVPDASDLDGVLVRVIEEHPVVAAAEPEASEWVLQLFHVTVATGQVMIDAVENLPGSLAINRPKIGAGFRRPDDRDPFRDRPWGAPLAH